MKMLYVSIVSFLLVLCEGDSGWPTRYPYTTESHGVNLKGKMLTLSQDSGVTFYPPYWQAAPTATAWTTGWTTQWPTQWPTSWTPSWTTPSPTRGVSVCLRFMTESSSFTLFKLAPRSPLSFTWGNPWCTLTWNYYYQVSLNPRLSFWSSVRTQPWTSVCVVLDSYKNVAQVFQGGAMSIRKILPTRMVWTGEPVLDMSSFDGQVTDLEVWDRPLSYREVFGYMQNFGPSGTVLTWSNIGYRYSGSILLEDTYTQQMKQPLSNSDGDAPPNGRKHRKIFKGKMFKGKKQRKRQTF